MATIAENVHGVREQIWRAAEKSGRDPQSITLIAVSKAVPPERLAECLRVRLNIFGENRLQEAQAKINGLAQYPKIHWHFIGHLQTNKVGKAVSLFEMLQSVDGAHLLDKINEQAQRFGKIQSVLLEINLAGEASKTGLRPDQLPEFLAEADRWPNVRLCGLMAIPPWHEDRERSRPFFAELRKLSLAMSRYERANVKLTELSMGMSHDFTVAIEEGATMVRIGTLIFGARQ
ncbi:MAG: YggS family pyridoxal phosphate-dependent enzyme [Acidobacteria bacterium]|nr:YggS family pyridoxal phosphate-dependent enzyme [Acidobacteriota bacterium]MBI3656336.1 YggS family pyridoxal phosphate-dependent enzyme [Acidobacteriota bacterium]